MPEKVVPFLPMGRFPVKLSSYRVRRDFFAGLIVQKKFMGRILQTSAKDFDSACSTAIMESRKSDDGWARVEEDGKFVASFFRGHLSWMEGVDA